MAPELVVGGGGARASASCARVSRLNDGLRMDMRNGPTQIHIMVNDYDGCMCINAPPTLPAPLEPDDIEDTPAESGSLRESRRNLVNTEK